MNLEEYNLELRNLEDEHQKKIRALNVRYAFENCKFKEGDIIDDGLTRIKIHKIKYGFMHFGVPHCVFSGIRLTKGNRPYKNGETDTVYGMHKINKINK